MTSLSLIINDTSLGIKEYQGQRVVTLKDVDNVHKRPEGTARRNFNDNKERFIEGIDYFKVCANEIRTHKILELSPKSHEDITFLTESGYLMLVKSFTDDLAWDVQRKLIDTYFRVAGKYDIANLLDNPDLAIQAFTALKEEREKNKQLVSTVAVQTQQIAELKPKASYYDVVLNCKDLISTSSIAKDYGKSAIWLNRYLHEKNVQFKQGDIWLLYQKYASMGYTSTKTQSYNGSDGEVHTKIHTYWTQKRPSVYLRTAEKRRISAYNRTGSGGIGGQTMRKLSVKEEKAVSQIAQVVVNCTHRHKNPQVATAMALIGTGFILLTSGVSLNRWMLLVDALDEMMYDPDSILFQERQKSLEL